jgi:hypothetical protein
MSGAARPGIRYARPCSADKLACHRQLILVQIEAEPRVAGCVGEHGEVAI